INFEPLGQGATWTNAQMARIAGQTTDVTATYGFAPQDIINFQPDTQFLDLSGLSSIKTFDQTNVARFMTWKGKVWQMTLAYVGHLVWANEDMLAKYFDPAFSGIDYPTGAGLFATGKYAMWPEGSFSGGDIMAAKPTFQKLGAFNAPWSDDAAANAVQPVYGDIGWAGLKYTKNPDMVL